jgi:hypothetical protein
MKTFLIGLIALSTLTAFAESNCKVAVRINLQPLNEQTEVIFKSNGEREAYYIKANDPFKVEKIALATASQISGKKICFSRLNNGVMSLQN